MSNGNFGLYTSNSKSTSQFGHYTPFMRISFKLVQLLNSRDSAWVLSYLMNHHTKVASQYDLRGGRFYVTEEQFEHECKMPLKRQREVMARLERKGFIACSLIDGRWICRILYKAINKAIDRLE